ncbi:MAG TPA: serine hydrolase [Candidatus Limnocylindria bacterium]|nr:serine hydrolase [Candidatus Limnocylindria bacterium]
MPKYKALILLLIIFLSAPNAAFALDMPQTANDLASMARLDAQAYVVADANTGEILISKNADLAWTPASLTKLVTVLVVLDTKPKLTKTVAITQADQTAGSCNAGGACIKAKAGVKFTVDGLFHAALIPSANNAANALARSTGLTPEAFAKKMNEKAQSLGAVSTHFNEPTGMDPTNQITAADYAKIVAAAFSNPYLRNIAAQDKYSLRSSNNSKYNQIIKNTDKLLTDSDVQVLGAKTGYLNESQYNFASLMQYNNGKELAVVVLGEKHLYTAFAETKLLASYGQASQFLASFMPASTVLGTTTNITLNN